MRIKCINIGSLKYQFLKIGETYVAYGMGVSRGNFYYLICDEAHQRFPIPKPADFFEIVDDRLSRYWIFGFMESYEDPRWTFPEWVRDPYFADHLTDYNPREEEIFRSYRKLMDLEFPDPSIVTSAEVGDDQWLLCPNCIDGWQSIDDKDAMVICPKCIKVMHNPRYQNFYPHI